MSKNGEQDPGKSWDFCPTRSLFGDRLVNGKIDAQDAIFLWDMEKDGESTAYINIEVGLLPKRAFTELGGTLVDKEKWGAWSRQWQNIHGGGDWAGWMKPADFLDGFASWGNTPERVVAVWLSDGNIPLADREALLTRLSERIHNFSINRVKALAKERTEARGRR